MGKIKKQHPERPPVGPSRVVFGFSELRPLSYKSAERDGKFFISYIERLKRLCLLDWSDLRCAQRHSFGTEKISLVSLSPAAQNNCPAGVDGLLALRAAGDNHAFLGYRDGNVFQVVFIEYQFGDIYRHC
mgnify:FL=1